MYFSEQMKDAKLPRRIKENMRNYDEVTVLNQTFFDLKLAQLKAEGEVCIISCYRLNHENQQMIVCSYCHRDVFLTCDKVIADTPEDKRKCHDCTLVNVSSNLLNLLMFT